MSFDLAFWYEREPRTAECAAHVYEQLTDGLTGIVEENASAIGGFTGDLVAAFPDLTQENVNDSPWSSPVHHDSECAIVTISWPRQRELTEFLLDLAIRHGLAAYDPQNQILHHPGSAADVN